MNVCLSDDSNDEPEDTFVAEYLKEERRKRKEMGNDRYYAERRKQRKDSDSDD